MTTTNAAYSVSPTLHIARVPGELGPVVRCSGDLTVATGEALKRQLDLLMTLRVPVLTLNVAGCRHLDIDGVLLLLDTYKRLRAHGQRFTLVAGTSAAANMLRLLAIDAIIPIFPTEASAASALRGAAPPAEAPATWAEARVASLAMWRSILEALDQGDADTAAARITTIHGLCERAQHLLELHGAPDGVRCNLCPLFHALGGRSEDVGCESATQPMLEGLLHGDWTAARAQVSRLLRLIESMPLPEVPSTPAAEVSVT